MQCWWRDLHCPYRHPRAAATTATATAAASKRGHPHRCPPSGRHPGQPAVSRHPKVLGGPQLFPGAVESTFRCQQFRQQRRNLWGRSWERVPEADEGIGRRRSEETPTGAKRIAKYGQMTEVNARGELPSRVDSKAIVQKGKSGCLSVALVSHFPPLCVHTFTPHDNLNEATLPQNSEQPN